MSRQPSVGDTVHYVSYGTPGGEYESECRTATVTETYPPDDSGELISDTIGLAVVNPTGLFFHPLSNYGCEHSEGERRGGTWHWPHQPEVGE